MACIECDPALARREKFKSLSNHILNELSVRKFTHSEARLFISEIREEILSTIGKQTEHLIIKR